VLKNIVKQPLPQINAVLFSEHLILSMFMSYFFPAAFTTFGESKHKGFCFGFVFWPIPYAL